MSVPQELEDYLNYQWGIIDALNHSLAHITNDLTISQGIIITSYQKLLSRVNPNISSLRLYCDQEPAKYAKYGRSFDRSVRMRRCHMYNDKVYYTSYGNVIYINNDLSITVLGVPMIDETCGWKTVIPQHIRMAYRLFDPDFDDRCTMDITFACLMDVFIAADMSAPEQYEIRDSFASVIYDSDHIDTNSYDLGYNTGIDFVESIM